MADQKDKVNELLLKLDTLLQRQESFNSEINEIRSEINQLKADYGDTSIESDQPLKEERPELSPAETEFQTKETIASNARIEAAKLRVATRKNRKPRFAFKQDLEKFIGENLINKIGILITVLGVGIGAKYSIDNDLISPLTRIILGYLMGIVLLGFGIKLKSNYTKYSAVLVSGAIAILYFITYFAYEFYDLIPQSLSFGLMLIFTIFGVIAAINYNQQVIALIGLVGAYAVPFLIGDASGSEVVLFMYMALINIGILTIAVKRYWKLLYYSAFIMTWLIYSFWYAESFDPSIDARIGFIFLTTFFLIFYSTFLVYKLVQKQIFNKTDIALILSNTFIFYGFGYSILSYSESGTEALGLFTLGNALIHFIICAIIYKQELGDRNLFYFVSGLVLVFITITIPVQLDGSWVTLLWAGEAALLFWIGRTKGISFYEKLSYPLMILAVLSIFFNWWITNEIYYPGPDAIKVTPLWNVNFLVSILFIAAFGWINYLNQNKQYTSPFTGGKGIIQVMSIIIPAIFLAVLYYTFRIEIEIYWNQLYQDSRLTITPDSAFNQEYYINSNLEYLKIVWVLNYTLFFLSALSFVNIKWIKNKLLGHVNIIFNIFSILAVLTLGIETLSNLRTNYINQTLAEYYTTGPLQISIRYLSFGLIALLLFMSFRYLREEFINSRSSWLFDLLLHSTVLWIASSELIHWMDLARSTQPDKIGLSILWGVYSLILIIIGIWRKKKHLRLGAIILFSITLIKLFAYDISDLETIAKTIVFVSLGILLLIISFLYNKYKHIINDEVKNS